MRIRGLELMVCFHTSTVVVLCFGCSEKYSALQVDKIKYYIHVYDLR